MVLNIDKEDIEKAKSIVKDSPELLASSGLLIFGLLLLFAGIVVGTTAYFATLIGVPEYVNVSMTLLGVAVPSLLLGVYILLPSRRSQKIGAAVSIFLTAVGTVMFNLSYPQALGAVMFLVAMTYSVGVVVMLMYIFLGVANVNNAPKQPSPPKYRRRSRVTIDEDRAPKTGMDVVKDIIRKRLPTEDVDQEMENRVNLSNVAESFENDMNRNADMIESITVADDVIEVKKQQSISDARFVTAIPEYVSVKSVNNNIYTLEVREEDYRLAKMD